MAEIEPIDIQVTKLVGRLSAINSKEIPAAQAWVLNRSLSVGTTALSRLLSQQLKVPVRKVKKRLYQQKAKPFNLRARLRVYSRGIPAIELPGIRDKGRYKKGRRGRAGTGVSARGGHSWGDAFIAKGSGGKKHVFYRTRSSAVSAESLDVYRVAIKQKAEQQAPRVLQNEMQQNYGPRLRKELSRRIDKYKA